jgi:hypothetical protein
MAVTAFGAQPSGLTEIATVALPPSLAGALP